MELGHRRKIGLFLAIAFVGSWSIAGTLVAAGAKWEGATAVAFGILYMLPPALAALIVKGPVAKDPVVDDLAIRLRPNRWWLAAWLMPPLAVAATIGVDVLIPGVDVSTSVERLLDFYRDIVPEDQFAEFEQQVRDTESSGMHPLLRMLLQAMVAGMTLNAVVTLGEELGWRGFLHHEIGGGFWRKSLIVGVVWGVWHAPIVAMGHNFPDHPAAGVPVMIGWCVLLAPILAYVRERSRTVIAPAIFHGTLNATAGMPVIVASGGGDLISTATGLAGFVAFGALLGLLWLHDRFVAEERVMVATGPRPAEAKGSPEEEAGDADGGPPDPA